MNDTDLAIKLLGSICIIETIAIIIMILGFFGYNLRVNGKSKGIILTTDKGDILLKEAELKDSECKECKHKKKEKKESTT